MVLAAARVCPDDAALGRLERHARRPLDWSRVLRLAQDAGVSGLLYRNLRQIGVENVPGAAMSELQSRFAANGIRNLALTGELLRIVRCFSSEGIQAIPFKGPTLAAIAYGDPALREFGDLDLLVHPRDFSRAAAVLQTLGFRPGLELSERRREAYRRALGQVPFFNGQLALVELHDRLLPRSFRCDLFLEWLPQRLQTVSVLGQELTTLPMEELLLYLTAHGAKHAWSSLAAVVDVAEVLRYAPQLQWDRLWSLARRVRGERMLQLALLLAHELLDAAVPAEITGLSQEATLRKTADRIEKRLVDGGEVSLSSWERARFHWIVRERWPDGIGYCLNLALAPTAADWLVADFPPGFSFLYYFLRPLRLAGKYGRQWLRPARRADFDGAKRASRADVVAL
jgi:hypothetical protein